MPLVKSPCKDSDADGFDDRTEEEGGEGVAGANVAEVHGEVGAHTETWQVEEQSETGAAGAEFFAKGEVDADEEEDTVHC